MKLLCIVVLVVTSVLVNSVPLEVDDVQQILQEKERQLQQDTIEELKELLQELEAENDQQERNNENHWVPEAKSFDKKAYVRLQQKAAEEQKKKTVTWDTYLQQLLAGGHLTQAAIIGLDGTIWVKSSGLDITSEEFSFLLTCLTNLASNPGLTAGVELGGETFRLRDSSENKLLAKNTNNGVTVNKAGQCVVLGIYKLDSEAQGDKMVTTMRDYLYSIGY